MFMIRDGRYFSNDAEYQAFLAQSVVEEVFRQKAVIVKQAADQNLRNQFELLLPDSAKRFDRVEFLVIREDGVLRFFGSRSSAEGYAQIQTKICAIGEFRPPFKITNLPEAELAARVAAL